MALTQPPPPVKYFIAVLFGNSRFLVPVRSRFIEIWGEIDFEGEDHPFDVTDYYADEMGSPLFRRIFSFKTIEPPDRLVAMKLSCNALEEQTMVGGKRTVNCDAGYLDHNKTVLASAKEAGQKIYLDKGIYADLAGRYKNGAYRPFEWSFPDFKDGRYDRELLSIRSIYLTQCKIWRRGEEGGKTA